jgi:uncharacterized membrane protein YhhN
MKQKSWIFLLALALIGDLIAVQTDFKVLEYVCKPLIIPAIIGYFHASGNHLLNGINKWVAIALLFSLSGDVFLLFQDMNGIFFLSGLAAFLVAHIFYIIYFHHIRIREHIKGNPWLLVIVVIYYAVLISFLSPYLGDMKIPVRIYGIVISFMFMLAMHMLFISNKKAGRWMMTGALFFVISDSVLAFNKFFHSFELANILIMLTYAAAQFNIVNGAAYYNNSTDKR